MEKYDLKKLAELLDEFYTSYDTVGKEADELRHTIELVEKYI